MKTSHRLSWFQRIKKTISAWFARVTTLLRHSISRIKKALPEPLQNPAPSREEILGDVSAPQKESDPLITMPSSTTRHALIFWLVGLFVLYIGYMGYQILDLLYLIFAGLIISIAMESIIIWRGRWLPRGMAIAVGYILLLLFIVLGMAIMIPFVLQQVAQMLSIVIEYFYTVQSDISTMGLIPYIEQSSTLPSLLKEMIINSLQSSSNTTSFNIQEALLSNISNIVTTGSDYATQVGSWAVSIVSGLMTFLGQVGIVLTVAVFFSIEKAKVVRRFSRLRASESGTESRLQTIEVLYTKMWLWIKSQMSLCVYMGIIVYVVLWILDLFGLDIPNKGTLAIIAWFTEFIPYVWPLLWGLPAVIIATTLYGLPGFIIVSLVYYAVQWTENNVMIPTLMKKSLGVSPLLIFLCMLVAGSILGFVGILLAVPIAVILSLLFEWE